MARLPPEGGDYESDGDFPPDGENHESDGDFRLTADATG